MSEKLLLSGFHITLYEQSECTLVDVGRINNLIADECGESLQAMYSPDYIVHVNHSSPLRIDIMPDVDTG